MREILFRGKSVNDGGWVQGSLVITTIEPADDTPIKHYHIEDMTIGVFPNEFQSGLSETVDPVTVGQFTGLTDKNGKKIFEGDILRITWSVTGRKPVYEIHSVEYFKSGFFTKREGDFRGQVSNYACSNCKGLFVEVIGNIHDNPELLGGAE